MIQNNKKNYSNKNCSHLNTRQWNKCGPDGWMENAIVS